MINRHIFVLICIMLTAAALLAYNIIPEQKLDLSIAKNAEYNLYVDSQTNGNSTVEWKDENTRSVQCTLRPSNTYMYCGISITPLNKKQEDMIDLSRYRDLLINISYEGSSDQLRLLLDSKRQRRDKSSEEYKLSSIYRLLKFELNQDIYVSLKDFQVALWWLSQNNISMKDARPNLNNVIALGIDLPRARDLAGEHTITINSIALIGPWISKELLYAIILFLWIIGIGGVSIYKLLHYKNITRISEEKISALSKHNATLKEKSTNDSLTGLLNRSGFEERRKKYINNDKKESYCLLLIDIDYFKKINDQYGHHIGDKALVLISNIIKNTIRSSDIVSRWGGEEFVVLCPETDINNAITLADKIRKEIEEKAILEKGKIQLTSSFGVAKQNENESFTSLFQRADAALYLSKEKGRNCVNASYKKVNAL